MGSPLRGTASKRGVVPPDEDAPARGEMRERIKRLTERLLVERGYASFRFHEVAEELGITRASIHYHFSSKQRLCEEVILESIEKASKYYEGLLTEGELSFADRLRRVAKGNRARYLDHNPSGSGRRPWALISRIRLEQDQLPATVRRALFDFRRSLERSVLGGIKLAVSHGELSPNVPAKQLALLFIAVVNSSDATTRDTGSFEAMEALYQAYADVALTAYGAELKSGKA